MTLTVEKRKSGIVIPLGALRSVRSGAVGEYADLPMLGGLCGKAGLSFIQLLPVNDTGFQSSPYSTLSAFALHPLYICIGQLPEAKAFQKEAEALAAPFAGERRFPYPRILKAKLDLLRRVFEKALPAIRKDSALEKWIAANPWVREYAVFLRLKARNGERSWKDWTEHRDPSPRDIEALWMDASHRDEHLFHAWLQLRCEEQFLSASRELASLGVALKGDLPILMNEDSADVWAHRSWFRTDRIAGAPPDMFSELGQNWGFPIYDWGALAREDYSFWKDRLRQAAKFYGAYRIDHVLGFFRIWALPEREESGYLGSYEPSAAITREELYRAGFSDDRLRWISEPHIRDADLLAASASEIDPRSATEHAARAALDRIGNEPLSLFKRSIRGEKDIRNLDAAEPVRSFLQKNWRDRVLVETSPGTYTPTWRYSSASAWPTLSDAERAALEGLVRSKADESEAIWEEHGRALLSVLKAAAPMLPCAEDLGAVPRCVPKVLADLGILGLRIPRWTRRWGQAGDPYIEPGDYPKLTVCAPSVHDTSTLRDWWENEADARDREAAYGGKAPDAPWSCRTAARVLRRCASGASVLLVSQLQDLLDLSEAYASKDPRSDRVNVPGTSNEVNWTWRMPLGLETLAADEAWTASVRKALAR